MSRLICMIFVADLIARRFLHECCGVDQELRGCGVGSLCDCCKWCLLLLACWCEELYGVRVVSEALVAYIVLVPFLPVE